MKNHFTLKKSGKALIIILFLDIIIISAAWNSISFSDWYRKNIFPMLQGIFSRISGIFPFSVGEIMIVTAIFLVIGGLISFAVLMIQKKGKRKRIAFLYGKTLVWILAFVLTAETLNFFILYHCSTFASVNNISENRYTPEQLYSVTLLIIEKTNSAAENITRDSEGHFVLSTDLHTESISAMKKLANINESFKGYYPNPKPLAFSGVTTRFNLLGIYFPFSFEANYNKEIYDLDKPFTVCHELTHLKGWILEDEANFISFLACTGSDNPEFIYSGYKDALEYLWIKVNSECRLSDEEYIDFVNLIDIDIRKDCYESHEVFRKAQEDKIGAVMAEISDTAIETSLKFNGVTDGAKSYGRFVDLLLNYYLDADGNIINR